jgi:hypothetical protein
MTRQLTLSLFAALLPAGLAAQARPDTLADIRNLSPREHRSARFSLESAQEVRVTAVGGEPKGRTALRRFLDNGVFQSKEEKLWDGNVWPGNAWILDTRTGQVVWELRAARTQPMDGLRAVDAMVRLPAGSYEVSYAALFPVSQDWDDDEDWRGRGASRLAADQLHGPYIDDGSYRRFQVQVLGTGRRTIADAPAPALVFVRGASPAKIERAGFELDRAMRLEFYAVGEGEGEWNDYGWVMDARTRRVVWTSRNRPGEHAGGARKNRMVREAIELPAGKYVAAYTTDDSHHFSSWNETPPWDPSAWGLSVRLVNDADRAAARAFEYQPVPVENVIVALNRLDDDELRWQHFSLARPAELQIFALGEGSGGAMHDYGWIVDSAGRVAWRMEYGQTETAGGAQKNRAFAGNVRLPAGKYVAYFTTDGSHSFGGGWNSDEPMDGEFWGMTVAPANPGRDVAGARQIKDADLAADPAILARLTRVRRGEVEAPFTLTRRTTVRVYAIGEGRGEMNDFASLDREGRELWRMEYPATEAAGGATKNRRIEHTMALEPGTYTLRFHSDGSHGWEDWNAPPPDDPLGYGVTVYRTAP